MDKHRKYFLSGIFLLIVILLIYFVSAEILTYTVSSNVTNGTTWYKGGASMVQNFTFSITGNASTNITFFNITNTNLTFTTATMNVSGWTCTASGNTTNCSNGAVGGAKAALAANLTVWYTLPSTATEINHTWNLTLKSNYTAFQNYSSWKTLVDGIAPVVVVYNYTNATQKANTGMIGLNILATDSGSNLSTSCLVDVNGTNQTILATYSLSGWWCNSTVVNLTGAGDGNQTIKIHVNDTALNSATNNSFVVFVDTTNPAASAVCSPSTVDVGDAFPCTCSESDNGTGYNSSLTAKSSTSPDGLKTPSNSGTFTYSCTAYDYAGNSVTGTATYTVREGGHSGGGGSGGILTVTPPVKSQTFAEITPSAAAIVKNFDAATGLKEIQITVNNPAQQVKVIVMKYTSKPAAVSVEKTGEVYQYLQINASNLADKLDKATVVTKVNKSWVSGNNLDKDNLALFKFDETSGQWKELSTNYSSEDDTYYYYTTDLTSFSYFAIAEKSLVSSGEGAEETPGDETTATTGNLTWLWIVISAIVLVAIIAAVMAMKKKKR